MFRYVMIISIALTIWPAFPCFSSFLQIDIGARPSGMGGAFMAISDDLNAITWNPAGLSGIEGKQILLVHNWWIEGTSEGLLAVSMPLGDRTSFSAGVLGFLSPGMERRDGPSLEPIGYFDVLLSAAMFSISKGITPALSAGATFKPILEIYGEDAIARWCFDLGAICRFGPLSFGFGARNISLRGIGWDEDPPTSFSVGFGCRPFGKALLISGDMEGGNRNGIRGRVGGEIEVGFLSIRLGYVVDKSFGNRISFGFGVLVPGIGSDLLEGNNFRADYSLGYHGELGLSHQISTLVRF